MLLREADLCRDCQTLHDRTLSLDWLHAKSRLRGGKAINVTADDAQTLAVEP